YISSLWYYNAGELPTKTILELNPKLVHRVKEAFGVRCCGLVKYLFKENVDEKEWKCNYYTIHTFYRWRWEFIPNSPKEIYEKDIWSLNTTFGQMARSVLEE
ncbi:uncharacterized protein B4U80_09550, partial [Leptotrombidium deliense]